MIHSLVGDRVKVETRKQGLAIDKYQFRTTAKQQLHQRIQSIADLITSIHDIIRPSPRIYDVKI